MANRRLTVIKCEPIFTGESKNGKPYTIYDCEALDDAGILLQDRMRSFSVLPINELVEYNVEHYVHPRQGDTYTIYPLRSR